MTNPIPKPIHDHLQMPCARFGYSLCHTPQRIQPIIGKKNPKRFHQPLLRSSGLPVFFVLTGTPHLGQTTAFTSILAPQFSQYLKLGAPCDATFSFSGGGSYVLLSVPEVTLIFLSQLNDLLKNSAFNVISVWTS